MKKTRAEQLEEYAKKEWEKMSKEEKAEYDSDFDFSCMIYTFV